MYYLTTMNHRKRNVKKKVRLQKHVHSRQHQHQNPSIFKTLQEAFVFGSGVS